MKMQHAFVKEYFTVRSGQGFYLKVKKQVAEGDRSGVYLIEDLCSDKLSALKMVPSQGNHLLSIHADIAVLQKFDHLCILKCLDHFTFSIRGNGSHACRRLLHSLHCPHRDAVGIRSGIRPRARVPAR